jgi:hypothetical protein
MSNSTVTVPMGAVKVIEGGETSTPKAKASKPTVSEKPAKPAGKKATDKKADKGAPFDGGKKIAKPAAKPAVKKVAAKKPDGGAKPATAPSRKGATSSARKPAPVKPVVKKVAAVKKAAVKTPAKKVIAAKKVSAKPAAKKAPAKPVKQTKGKPVAGKKPQPKKGERHGTYTNATMQGMSKEGTLGDFIKQKLLAGMDPAKIEAAARKRKDWANSKSLTTYIRVARKQLRDNGKLK